jgi:hypothetical protein
MKAINTRSAIFLLLISLLIVGFVYRRQLVFIAAHTVEIWRASDRISHALDGARSVVFVEFDDKGKTLRVAAKEREIAGLRQATNRWLWPSFPEGAMDFDPHHRVEVVRADGSQFQFVICFGSRNFYFDSPEEGVFGLPLPWRKSLTALFKSVGMTPFNSEDFGPDEKLEH